MGSERGGGACSTFLLVEVVVGIVYFSKNIHIIETSHTVIKSVNGRYYIIKRLCTYNLEDYSGDHPQTSHECIDNINVIDFLSLKSSPQFQLLEDPFFVAFRANPSLLSINPPGDAWIPSLVSNSVVNPSM